MNQTIKQDWVTDEINVFNGYTSSSKKFTESLGLISGKSAEFIAELRFIYFQKKFQFLITVNNIDETVIKSIIKSNMYLKLKDFFQNLIIIGYDESSFLTWDNRLSDYRFDTLSEFFKKKNPAIIENVGTSKEINKTINDNFQIWTRQYLSEYCTINDIDGFYLHGQNGMAIVELKRVKTSIAKWSPYIDDYYNYHALEQIKNEFRIPYYVIAYQENNQEYVALHILSVIGNKEIIGRRIIMEGTALQNYPFGYKYKSHSSN